MVSRLKNRLIAKVITRFPSLSKKFIDAYKPWETQGVPWTPAVRALDACNVALVTTAGIHLTSQKPFDMRDPDGDPSFREIDRDTLRQDLMITHDYYDHTDADRDLNIVFPLERLEEFASEGIIGGVAQVHYSFMGHIIGPHLFTLMNVSAPVVAARLKSAAADIVLLTPG